MDNYQLSRDRAQRYFLNFDQEALIRTWDLTHTKDILYISFLGREYAISRKNGGICRDDGTEAGFEEVLSIFDLLCHEGTDKALSGRWAPVNSLDGMQTTAGVGTAFHTGIAAIFDNIAAITGEHAKGAELSLENATSGMTAPFHAGAAKYFAEKGITVDVD